MISSAQYSITAAAAVKLAPTGIGYRTVHISLIGNNTVYLGTSAVTSSTGYALTKALGEHDITLNAGDELYGICGEGHTETATVLISEA